jgi:hypothetical protein
VIVALVIQYAKCMYHVKFSSVASPALLHFFTLPDKWYDFCKKVTKHKICVLIFSTNLSNTFFILRRIQRAININVNGLHVKYPYFCQVLMKLEFSPQIFKKYSNIKFHETPSSENQVVPCRQTDRQTDRHDKANSRFSHFCQHT